MQIRFGSSLAAVDPALGLSVAPRCFGEAEVQITDANAWHAAVAQMGGEEATSPAIQQAITKALAAVFGELVGANGVMKTISDTPALIQRTNEGASRALASWGVAVSIGSLNVNLGDEDMNHIRRLSAEAAAKKRAAHAQLSPGTHVIARWTDGREFGATIRGWNGTYYEIVWDGGTASAFLPKESVRIG